MATKLSDVIGGDFRNIDVSKVTWRLNIPKDRKNPSKDGMPEFLIQYPGPDGEVFTEMFDLQAPYIRRNKFGLNGPSEKCRFPSEGGKFKAFFTESVYGLKPEEAELATQWFAFLEALDKRFMQWLSDSPADFTKANISKSKGKLTKEKIETVLEEKYCMLLPEPRKQAPEGSKPYSRTWRLALATSYKKLALKVTKTDLKGQVSEVRDADDKFELIDSGFDEYMFSPCLTLGNIGVSVMGIFHMGFAYRLRVRQEASASGGALPDDVDVFAMGLGKRGREETTTTPTAKAQKTANVRQVSLDDDDDESDQSEEGIDDGLADADLDEYEV